MLWKSFSCLAAFGCRQPQKAGATDCPRLIYPSPAPGNWQAQPACNHLLWEQFFLSCFQTNWGQNFFPAMWRPLEIRPNEMASRIWVQKKGLIYLWNFFWKHGWRCEPQSSFLAVFALVVSEALLFAPVSIFAPLSSFPSTRKQQKLPATWFISLGMFIKPKINNAYRERRR